MRSPAALRSVTLPRPRSRLRAFRRWMRDHGVVCSDALRLDAAEDGGGGVYVRALAALREGDLVATIPRGACLTPRTSGAAEAIEAAELGGPLALAVAVMYERARGAESPWDAYLRLIPEREPVPLVWPADEAERLLAGTELDKVSPSFVVTSCNASTICICLDASMVGSEIDLSCNVWLPGVTTVAIFPFQISIMRANYAYDVLSCCTHFMFHIALLADH